MKFIIYTLLTVFAYSISFSQESGWADSLGYKQQKLKTGAVQQVRFTPSGDSIITVVKDKLWHLYQWDTHTGRLLRQKTIADTNYKTVYSVQTDIDCRTYTVAALWGDGKIHVSVFACKNDSLLHDILTHSQNVEECFAYYFSKTKILWVIRNTVYHEPFSGFDNSGIIAQYSLQSDTAKIIYYRTGSTHFVSFSEDGLVAAWKSLVSNFRTYKSSTIKDNVELFSVIRNNSLNSEKRYDNYTSGAGNFKIFLTAVSKINCILSRTGENYYNLLKDSIFHARLQGNIFSDTKKLHIIPQNLFATTDDEILFFNSDSSLFLLHCPTLTHKQMFETHSPIHLFTVNNTITQTVIITKNNQIQLFSLPAIEYPKERSLIIPKRINYVDSSFIFHTSTNKGSKKHLWSFGNGAIDSGLFVIHKFSKPGIYTVTLQTILDNNFEDTLTWKRTVTVLPTLIAQFSASPRFGQVPLPVQFTDESSGNILRWKWDFGDGIKDSIQHPSHTYYKSRYSAVRLTIWDSIESRTIEYKGYVNPIDLTLQEIHPVRKFKDQAQNYSLGQYQQKNYYNSFYSGCYTTQNQLFLYKYECYSEYYNSGGQSNEGHVQSQTIIDSANKTVIVCKPLSTFLPREKCSFKSGTKIIPFRNKQFVTSFEGFRDEYYKYSKRSGLYYPNNRPFSPDGWSHNFDIACLRNGTDVYLFRNQKDTVSLQFFIDDTVLVKRINQKCNYIDVFTSQDSNRIITVTTLPLTQSDSTVRIDITQYSAEGEIVQSSTIPFTLKCTFNDAFRLNDNEFLLCGSVPIIIDGKKSSNGYICKVNTNGVILWEHVIPTWLSFTKFQFHTMGYYAAFGRPFSDDKYGFLSLRENGKLLADSRLFNADNNFHPSDLVIGAGNDDIWFIGGENSRATYYQCSNPVTPTTDIEEKTEGEFTANDFSIFPNPAHSSITVRGYKGEISLVNAIGVVVERSYAPVIDIQHLPNGVYFVKAADIHTAKILSILR